MDAQEQIKNYIAAGKPQKAIKLLLEYTKANSPETYDEALLLSGQYNQWKRQSTLGIESSSSELRRIEMGVIDVLTNKESYTNQPIATLARPAVTYVAVAPPPTKEKGTNFSKILLGILGVTFLAVFIPIINSDSDPEGVEGSETSTSSMSRIQDKTVLEGALTKNQFDQQLAAYKEMNALVTQNRLDVSTVMQVRYLDEGEIGFFDKVPNSTTWMERNGTTNEVYAEYSEESRTSEVITLFDLQNQVYVFLSLTDDKVYEQSVGEEKRFLFKIIGAM